MHDLKVTIFQANLAWEDAEKNLRTFSKKMLQVPEETDLIILPEMFNTGFSIQPNKVAETINGPTFQWMRTQASKTGAVITGSFIVEVSGRFYNRLIWMEPNGFYLAYDKRHLFRMGGEHKRFSAGDKQLLVKFNEWKIRPLVCYDLRFPVWSKNLYKDNSYEYDLLIYTANWPDSRREVWKTLLKARAIENQAYVIGVNRIGEDDNGLSYAGDSMVINAHGKTVAETIPYEESMIYYVLDLKALQAFRDKFKVGPDWDAFELL
jgi:predicted amidohydrolase